MSARSLGQTYKVDPRGGPSATYVRTYELTKNLQDQGDSLTIRNAREKSDEIRDFSPRMNPRPEGDTMNSTDLPEFIATHTPGGRGGVLRRCDNDTCYTPYAETSDRNTAQHLVRRLNSTPEVTR